MENSLQLKTDLEIQPLGSYFDLDADGYVINPASIDKIQKEWMPMIDDIVEIYKKQYGDKLKNVYIRGSVAKGQAIKNVSDLDTWAFVDLVKEDIRNDWIEEVINEMKKKFPFAEDIQFKILPLSSRINRSVMLNQSVCVYGESVEIPKMKPGRTMMLHVYNFKERIEIFDKKMEAVETEEKVKKNCISLMKDLLRTSFELTMEKSHRYTRDLYLCYKGFSEYYPEKETQMREILHYALNPTGEKQKIIEIKGNFIPWLEEEIKKCI